jgi:membrane protease YdiL (CAAX protease family)
VEDELDQADRFEGQVASSRHGLVLGAILLGLAAAGYLALGRSTGAGPAPSGALLYLPLLAAEWGLFLYVRLGVRKAGHSLAGLISARPLSPRTIALDLLLGLLLLAAMLGLEAALDLVLGAGAGTPAGVQPLLVRRAADIPLWILLALSAGFVEELTFRGYWQRQFGAALGGPWFGLIAQAALFGITHGYQGPAPMLRIAILGLGFGLAARARRSLVPGMAAHALMDVLAGLAVLR